MAGIKIDFVSDVGKFISGTKDVSQALDKVADSLDDVAKDADRAGEEAGDNLAKGVKDGTEKVDKYAKDAGKDLADGLERGTRDAGDAGEKMERKFRSSFDAVKTDSKTTGDKVGTEIKSGFKKAEGAADEFKEEAASTSREAAASFSGDFEDVADAIQETLANALTGFGPAGAAAGMAAAAGVGILIASLQNSQEEAETARVRIEELADEIRDVGGDIRDVDWGEVFAEFARQITDAKSWFEPWQEASRTAIEDIKADADELGLEFSDLFQGMAGEQEAAAKAMAEINAEIIESERAALEAGKENRQDEVAAQWERADALREVKSALEEAAGATESAITQAELYREAMDGSTSAVESFNEAQEKKLGLIRDEAGLAMDRAEAEAAWAENAAGFAETQSAVAEAIDTTTDATRDATDAVTEGGTKLDLYTEAGRLASDQLIKTADAGWDWIEAAREGGASAGELREKTQIAREEFIKQATQLGLTEDAARRLADEYGLIPTTVETTAKFNKDAAQGDIDAFISRNNGRTITIYVDAQGRQTGFSTGIGNMTGLNSGGQVPGAASGVYVTGPGGDIEDRVPYMLSPGEMVLDKQAVDQIGVGNLFAKNEGIGRTGGADIATAVAAGVRDALANLPLTLQVEGQQMSAFIRPVAAGEVRAFEQTRRRVAR